MKTIAVTMGDAAGVGPEIIAAAWKQLNSLPDCRVVVYGHPEVMRLAAQLRNVNTADVNTVDAGITAPEIDCLPCCSDDVLDVAPGTIDARTGHAAYLSIRKAIEDAQNGLVDAVVTAPMNKAALHLAGHHYPGHTEIFAEQCGVENFAMMLYLGASETIDGLCTGGNSVKSDNSIKGQYGLAVIHVTLHTAMKTIFDIITPESVLAKIELVHEFMRRMMGDTARQPHLGVCSLNPHAGEGGLFGDEEIRIIQPAIMQAAAKGILVEGPQPADTIMLDARDGKYDAVVAMFHDQGHIALKLLGMYRAVNITWGLPIIRTSVAHGTAFDKAWKGIAEPGSLIEAVRTAYKLSRYH